VSGIGIDVLEIARMERALVRRPRLAQRLFSAQELGYARGRARPGQHLAARLCAKEAVVKALALDAMVARDIEIVGGGGDVSVALTGSAAARARELGASLCVSLTHSSETAAAVALVVPAPDPAANPAVPT
jgi:holo-[acyl-carrier protein] synthase